MHLSMTGTLLSADNPMEGVKAEEATTVGIRSLVLGGEEEKMRKSGREKENW